MRSCRLIKFIFMFVSYLFTQTTIAAINFHCAGTKPFWSLTINQKQMTFRPTNSTHMILKSARPRNAAGMCMGYLRVYETVAKKTNDVVTVVVKQTPDGCTDGTSEQIHGYETVVITSSKVLSGCCDRQS